MYIYDGRLPGAQSLLKKQPVTSPIGQRNFYYLDRGISAFGGRGGGSGSYVWENKDLGQLSDSPDTQVLYVPPTPPKPQTIGKIEFRWTFDAEGRREYETALDKHLKDKKLVSGNTVYEPLSSSADIATLANTSFANLVLIVHGASNGPAIGVDLGSSAAGTKADWIKDDEFAKVIAPFGYTNITVLGCDSVSNKFTPNLAKHLPKGSTITGHKGGAFEIRRHFKPNKDKGRLQLTRVSSNLKLQKFKTKG